MLLLGQLILIVGLIISALVNPINGYWLAIGLPMILVVLGKGWILSPLTNAVIYNVVLPIKGSFTAMLLII